MKVWCACWSSKGASISLEEIPWWLWFLQWIFDGIPTWLHFHDVPLPNWPRCCGDEEDKKYNDGKYFTPREYYGDLGCIWVCSFINNFINKLYPKHVKEVSIPLTDEQMTNHINQEDRNFWIEEQQRRIEFEAEEARREATAGDSNQCDIPGSDSVRNETSS
jgi:hypothetical protein